MSRAYGSISLLNWLNAPGLCTVDCWLLVDLWNTFNALLLRKLNNNLLLELVFAHALFAWFRLFVKSLCNGTNGKDIDSKFERWYNFNALQVFICRSKFILTMNTWKQLCRRQITINFFNHIYLNVILLIELNCKILKRHLVKWKQQLLYRFFLNTCL